MIDKIAQNIFDPHSRTFRKGQIGTWQSELPDKYLNMINQTCESLLISLEYHI